MSPYLPTYFLNSAYPVHNRFLGYFRTLSLKFQKARIRIEDLAQFLDFQKKKIPWKWHDCTSFLGCFLFQLTAKSNWTNSWLWRWFNFGIAPKQGLPSKGWSKTKFNVSYLLVLIPVFQHFLNVLTMDLFEEIFYEPISIDTAHKYKIIDFIIILFLIPRVY